MWESYAFWHAGLNHFEIPSFSAIVHPLSHYGTQLSRRRLHPFLFLDRRLIIVTVSQSIFQRWISWVSFVAVICCFSSLMYLCGGQRGSKSREETKCLKLFLFLNSKFKFFYFELRTWPRKCCRSTSRLHSLWPTWLHLHLILLGVSSTFAEKIGRLRKLSHGSTNLHDTIMLATEQKKSVCLILRRSNRSSAAQA